MREIAVGVKVDEEGKLQEFGSAEVNELIEKGWQVANVRSKGAMMRKSPDGKQWSFIGYGIQVTLLEPG